MAFKIRKPFDPSVGEPLHFTKPSRAKQSFKDECNINTIMAKYQKTGLIEHAQKHQGSYGDFSTVEDYQSSLNQVMAADAAFSSLPSSVRRRFENSPAQFLAFVEDPANEAEMRKMGLLPTSQAPLETPAGVDVPSSAPVTPPASTPPPAAS